MLVARVVSKAKREILLLQMRNFVTIELLIKVEKIRKNKEK